MNLSIKVSNLDLVLHGSLDGLRLTILLEGVLRCDDGRCLAVDVLHDLATHGLYLGLQGLFVHFAILKIDTVLIKWIFGGQTRQLFCRHISCQYNSADCDQLVEWSLVQTTTAKL